MNIKKIACIASSVLTITLAILGDANAAAIDAKCEVRSGRSKISVDGRGFASGVYRASVRSGTATVFSRVFQRPISGELEYDFDSNPADIKAGATPISAAFIKSRSVRGNIYSYNTTKRTYTLRASVVASCKAK